MKRIARGVRREFKMATAKKTSKTTKAATGKQNMKIGFIGLGNMARAIIGGIIEKGNISPKCKEGFRHQCLP